MGMTIDEAIYTLEHHKPNDMKNAYDIGQAIEVLANTVHKYQKIEDIVSSKTTRLSYEKGFRQIKEVVEDGND